MKFSDDSFKHPEYIAWLPSWVLMRDAFDGTEAIKKKGEEYLPQPSGMKAAPDPAAAYDSFKGRAQYPELVAPTIRGMSGVMHGKPSEYDVPPRLSGMVEKATKDGLTLASLHRQVSRDVLKVGRRGLLVDVPASGGDPYIASYATEDIVSWDVDPATGNLSYVALREGGNERDPETGKWEAVIRWRILDIDEAGYYRVQQYDNEGAKIVEDEFPAMSGGGRIDFIPFVFVDTNDLTPEPDEIPLLPLARIAVGIYRADADYRHTLYLTGQPTYVRIGASADSDPLIVGGSVAWDIPPGGDAKILEFSGQGAGAQRQLIQDDLARAAQVGARLLTSETQGQESGEARKLRYANETATLTSIAQNVAAGLEKALRFAAKWIGADEKAVNINPNLDFVDMALTPEQISALVGGWQAGAYSYETLFDNLKRGEIISQDREMKDERDMIDFEPPLGDISGDGE